MRVPILSIVGRSNSGKTTLLEKLIAELTRQGLCIGTMINSHHHPDMDTLGKDSWRYIALNLIKADKSSKIGIKNRRLIAGWNNDYLERLLTGTNNFNAIALHDIAHNLAFKYTLNSVWVCACLFQYG